MGFNVLDTLAKLATESGFAGFFAEGGWQNLVMIVIACVLLYLGIVKGFEPLLLVGIAFGCLLANVSYFPGLDAVNPDLNATNALYHPELWEAFLDKNNEFYHSYGHILSNAGLLDIFYIGVKAGLYPSLIFMGVGAMTDFGPLIADPKSLLLGAIAIAAYSYMALIPLIQPPIMKLLTSEKDRQIKMTQARPVSKNEKILFPIIVTIFVILLLPSTAPLIGCLMLGNLFRECGVTDRLSDTVQNALMNIITIFLSTSVGATMVASNFLKLETLKIILLGLVAFGISTVGGLIGGNIMCKASKGKVNPLIGSAGVSAVPMAARVSQMVGQKANPANFLLMHAMGPNVAGVIGSAIAAGFLLAVFG